MKAKWLVATLIAAVLAGVLLAACGGSAAGSDQFRDQTDSPILDFGEESDESELEEAADLVHGYYLARAREDWPAACAQLSTAVLAKIERLAISATGLKDKSCPAFLEAFTRLSAGERRQSVVVDAGSLRQQGSKAFLIYSGAGEIVYAMPLSKQGRSWKVASLSSKRLGAS